MRKILAFLIFVNLAFAAGDDFYQKALEFENKGDFKNAMKFYKLAAQNGGISANLAANSEINSNANFDTNSPLQPAQIYAENSAPQEIKPQNRANSASEKRIEYGDDFWLSPYKPTYIGYAGDFTHKNDRKHQEVKFQLSFQKPIWRDMLGYGDTLSIAYTQTSWWQVLEDSLPFRETSYQPEIFWTLPIHDDTMKNLKIGYLHESNGKGGDESRSWNRVYASTDLEFGNLKITPRIWHSFVFDDGNDDIRQYMGYGDINFEYTFGRHKAMAMVRNNLRFDSDNRGALELGFMFPLFNTGLKGYLQYFTGYGESLADYNKHVDKLMLGVGVYE